MNRRTTQRNTARCWGLVGCAPGCGHIPALGTTGRSAGGGMASDAVPQRVIDSDESPTVPVTASATATSRRRRRVKVTIRPWWWHR